MKKCVCDVLEEFKGLHGELCCVTDALTSAFEVISACYNRGGRLFVCGNGGSAADGEHIVGELLKSFRLPRPLPDEDKARLCALGARGALLADKLERGLPVLALSSHPSFASAYANDADAVLTFAQQLYAQSKRGDVLLAISTSGNSENCLYAATAARAADVAVVALTGADGGKLGRCADVAVRVPATETFRVQEQHEAVYHALCAMLEREFFSK